MVDASSKVCILYEVAGTPARLRHGLEHGQSTTNAALLILRLIHPEVADIAYGQSFLAVCGHPICVSSVLRVGRIDRLPADSFSCAEREFVQGFDDRWGYPYFATLDVAAWLECTEGFQGRDVSIGRA